MAHDIYICLHYTQTKANFHTQVTIFLIFKQKDQFSQPGLGAFRINLWMSITHFVWIGWTVILLSF